MKLTHGMLLLAALVLSACSSSHRVTYSGHQESTEGVPGFKGGKRLTPYVKLGQSYTVDGETYTPRHQPDYVEEGLASWYGPGFHGGKTANGEEFDKHDLTAAHRTLPLPSVVNVTLLSTGKQIFVRVNDRGPFSKGRIIDLSYGAAQKIGLLGKGVDRVRVEYMPAESQLFADLLASGRDPKSIDLEQEILGQAPRQYAQQFQPSKPEQQPAHRSALSRLNPITSAYAAPPEVSPDDVQEVEEDSIDARSAEPAPVQEISAQDLEAPTHAQQAPMELSALAQPAPTEMVAANPAASFLQLGAFRQQANAERLVKKHSNQGQLFILTKPDSAGEALYVVRMGPFTHAAEAERASKTLEQQGIEAKIVRQ